MERKIYFYLSITASITAALINVFISFFILDKNNFIANFLTLLPVTIGILVFILILLNIASYFLTKKIMAPINNIIDNIENILTDKSLDPMETYEELNPLIDTIRKQKFEIEDYVNKLEEMDKYRKDFTANITHDLKTPLTSINGFAEVISSGIASKEDSIKFGKIIYKEGNRLLFLIDSILNLSSIEMEDSPFELLDLNEIFSEIYPSLNIIAKKENIRLNYYVENVIINGNRRMIEDLLYNLIHNSIKYNKENGSVNISIERDEDSCIIDINDTGIGISKEDQDKIFDRFYIAEESRNKNISGTGLGLSIVKHIVKAHHGNINLISEVNKGTDIRVTLPIN